MNKPRNISQIQLEMTEAVSIILEYQIKLKYWTNKHRELVKEFNNAPV